MGRITARLSPRWVGPLLVLLPLALLLGFQYTWLKKLERSSTVIREATLNNYLEAVTSGVEYFYRSVGERALNLPSSVFLEGRLESVDHPLDFVVSLQQLDGDPSSRVWRVDP